MLFKRHTIRNLVAGQEQITHGELWLAAKNCGRIAHAMCVTCITRHAILEGAVAPFRKGAKVTLENLDEKQMTIYYRRRR